MCKKKDSLTRAASLSIPIRIVCFPDKVVDAGVIDAGKLDENRDGNVRCADFVLAVAGLGNAELCGDGGLFQVVVFTQIADARVGDMLPHDNHLAIIIS